MKNISLTIHTDGGSRGNPGPAASAFVISQESETVFEGSKYLGNTTNNVAEYTAVLLALQWIEESIFKKGNSAEASFILDSELVVKQLTGVYRIKDENLNNIAQQIFNLIKTMKIKLSFHHVPREKNKEADLLVNKELDNNL